MQTQDALTKAYTQALYPNNAKGPGAPKGQVSQPVYLPGALSSTAQLSEQLPPGYSQGATEANRGIFGTGSNVLVPQGNSTVTIAEPPKAPVDPGVYQTQIELKEPSGAGHTQLLDAGDGRVAGDVPGFTTPAPTAAPGGRSLDPAILATLLAATRAPKQPSSDWSFKNPWITYGLAFAIIFPTLIWAFRKRPT